jgi:hypothetical protein
LHEVLAVAACHLRQAPRFTVTPQQAWARQPDPEADDAVFSGVEGRSFKELDRLHREAFAQLARPPR